MLLPLVTTCLLQLSCLLAAALAMPHHSPAHDAAEAKPAAAAESPAKPQESEKPAEAKPAEEHKEAEAVKPEAVKPEADSVKKDDVKKETPGVVEVPLVPIPHADEHHAAEPKPVRSWTLHQHAILHPLASHHSPVTINSFWFYLINLISLKATYPFTFTICS